MLLVLIKINKRSFEPFVFGSRDSNKQYSCSKRLIDLCQQRSKGTDSFTIPLMAVHEMRNYICGMNNKKSSGPDEISTQLLNLASTYIAG